MQYRHSSLLLLLLSFLLLASSSTSTSSDVYRYQIGTGKGDMTGPVSEVTFMGYAEWSQVGQGLLQRIYARAFIVHDEESTKKRVVFVNTDTQSMGDIVKKRVVQQLQAMYGPTLYTADNVMLSSTHTHSSMGGYLQYSKCLYLIIVNDQL